MKIFCSTSAPSLAGKYSVKSRGPLSDTALAPALEIPHERRELRTNPSERVELSF